MSEATSPVIPLTTAQRGMWVGNKINTDNPLMLGEALELFGPIDPNRLIAATRRITEEFDTLRLRIVERDGLPRQVIDDEYRGDIPYFDVSDDPAPRSAAEHWAAQRIREPEDLENGPLWHCALFRLGADHHLWVQYVSHLVIDGFSVAMLVQRLAEIYTVMEEGGELGESGYGSSADLVALEKSYRTSDRFERDRAYWKSQLADLPPVATLARPREYDSAGLVRGIGHFPPYLVSQLREIGKRYGATLPQVLISILAAYYYRHTGAQDLVFAMPVTGRANPQYRRTPGMVANVIYLRLAMRPDQPVHQLFGQVASVVRNGLRHQQYRFEDVRRDQGYFGSDSKLARLAVNIEAFDYDLRFGQAYATPHNLSNGPADDLTIFCYERGDGTALRFDLDANPALYDEAELAEHCRRIVYLADRVLLDPEAALGAIDVLGATERTRLLDTWNDPGKPLTELATLPQRLIERAARMPTAVALQYGDCMLDYRTLCGRAATLAAQWVEDGVRVGDVVAVALPRSEQLLVALLAVMWSGAAYLPLDPQGPRERNRLMIEDAGASALVCEAELAERLLPRDVAWLDPRPMRMPAPLSPRATPDGVAYVLYTSGSTGKPKGVEIRHRNLAGFLQAIQRELMLQPSDRVLAITTVTFDIAGLEFYLPLATGARVVMAPDGLARDPRGLAQLVADAQINVLQATPSLWRILLANHDLLLDRVHALVGGEALGPELAARLVGRVGRLTQLYGPTEATIWSTIMPLQLADAAQPPIGRPLANTRVYVLDAQQQPLPSGAVGELYIGGSGVARGYRGRDELTAERFMPDPFADDGSTMYRSGDLVRWRADGVLEFIGRADAQLKIRGHRVEPGEIENALLRHPDLTEAAVVGHADGDGGVHLVGYVVGRQGEVPTPDQLRDHLLRWVPHYMVPTQWVPMASLPLTPNGKLDRKALPEPGSKPERAHVPPRDALERQLAELWASVLGATDIGVEDNFFELGGDSLTAAEMAARFPSIFGVDLPLGTLFHAPTIAGLADVVKRAGHAPARVEPLDVLLRLREGQPDVPALFCIHPVVGLGWSFLTLLGQLDPHWPVYALQSPGLRDASVVPDSIEAIASRYLEQIRSVQPQGPYRLLGWSLGGVIAHAIAAELRHAGERVELLAMLDAYPHEAAAETASESESVRAAVRALGLVPAPGEAEPTTMGELAQRVCDHYGLTSLPLVRQLLDKEPALLDNIGALTQRHLQLARRHRPQAVDVDLVFVEATLRPALAEGEAEAWVDYRPQAWQPYVGRLQTHALQSDHHSMLSPQHSATLARVLHEALRAPVPSVQQDVKAGAAYA